MQINLIYNYVKSEFQEMFYTGGEVDGLVCQKK